ncbi:hypothetical protein SEA_PRAIRIE_63 [Arthrobacter phage Prairie]|uniref:Uncharacterized protein n=1 Tax=Arthrobacter phage Prairie TaxID=2816463 RepID=A0A8A5LK73_9CAUD|nr:hypothetical protein SEA_PRAIRIE_63 [Arthrobacter phage Prairie]
MIRIATITPADRPPLFGLNRLGGKIIGVAVRLPDEETLDGRVLHHALSVWIPQ